MSLILEALKKSEQQRRLGEAPNLSSPVVATRRRRGVLPVLVILILAAGAAAWWLSHRAPTPATTPPPVAANGAGTTMRPAPQTRPAPPVAANRTALDRNAARMPPKVDQDKRVGLPANATHKAPPAATTVQVKPVPTPPAAKPTLADKSAGLRTPAPPPTDGIEKRNATPPISDAKKPDPAVIAPPSQAKKATPPAQGKAAIGEALPTVWELPYATRKDLPALDLSMHVYSSDPKQRFVVLKGDRHVEGDEVGQDLILREIRQDGVVFEYKGTKFFFPRTGR